jgi:hypothetical protein
MEEKQRTTTCMQKKTLDARYIRIEGFRKQAGKRASIHSHRLASLASV